MRPFIALLAFGLAITFAVSPFVVTTFAGFDPNQFPIPQIDPPVQPAGYAFSIWGVIYLWLIVGLGFGLLKRRDTQDWHAMRLPLVISLAVGTFWLAAANADPILASVLIWVMLIAALVALFKAPATDRWFAGLPVGLYAGWLTAACCVSIGLVAAGFGGIDQTYAAVGALLIALILANIVQTRVGRHPSYGIGVIWALVGVVIANAGSNATVAALAAGGAIALLVPTWRALRAS